MRDGVIGGMTDAAHRRLDALWRMESPKLLARLARGENARVSYLSLTRGEGGQNVIGPELFESLGIIRSEELLQARRLARTGSHAHASNPHHLPSTSCPAHRRSPHHQ